MNISLLIRSIIDSYFTNLETDSKVQETTITVEKTSDTKQDTEYTLQDVDGVGPKYEEKLENNDIKTVNELANKSPEDLEENVSISKDYAQRWISSAQELTS